MPQPYLVPVRPIFSRIAQSSGVSGSTSTSNALPLIVRFAIAFPLLGLVPALESDAGPKTAPVQIQILHIWRGIIDVRRGTSRFPGRGLPGVFGVSLQAISLHHRRHAPRMRGIQYAVAFRLYRRRLWDIGSPSCAGDDSGGVAHRA